CCGVKLSIGPDLFQRLTLGQFAEFRCKAQEEPTRTSEHQGSQPVFYFVEQRVNFCELTPQCWPIWILQVETGISISKIPFCERRRERANIGCQFRSSGLEFISELFQIVCSLQKPAN